MSRRSQTRSLFALAAIGGVFAGAIAVVACGDDDEAARPAVLIDASPITEADADVCNSYKGVGTPCSIPANRVCFPLCATGGCFCENGAWACRNDTSCLGDAIVVQDVTQPPVDADPGDASVDATDAEPDAPVDAASDAASDGALDAPNDADDAG